MSRKRAHEYAPNYLTEYKAHVDLIAAILMTGPMYNVMTSRTASDCAEAVNVAMKIIDEVDRAVDAELEQTGHESGVR